MDNIEYRAVIKSCTIILEWARSTQDGCSATTTTAQCSRAFLDFFNEDKDGVLSTIVAVDETCVHHYEPESKQDYAVA